MFLYQLIKSSSFAKFNQANYGSSVARAFTWTSKSRWFAGLAEAKKG